MFKNCRHCNNLFKTKPSHYNIRIYCSRKCQTLNKKKCILKNCVVCNSEFKFYNSTLKRGAQGKFCSLKCKGKYFKLEPVIKNCQNCNKRFECPTNYKIKKYCSTECYAKTMEGKEKPSFWETAPEQEKLNRLKESFEKYVIRNENGCWGWKGSLSKKYGSLQYGGKYKSISAHRASWIIHNGSIPDNIFVCHKCDNTRCFRPDHLFLGTPTDNVIDMHKKGRAVILKGENASGSKLSESEVIEIKKLLNKNIAMQKIADQFKVGLGTIFDIKHNKTWKYLNGD